MKDLLQLCGDAQSQRRAYEQRAALIAQSGLSGLARDLKAALSIGCSVVLAPAHVDPMELGPSLRRK